MGGVLYNFIIQHKLLFHSLLTMFSIFFSYDFFQERGDNLLGAELLLPLRKPGRHHGVGRRPEILFVSCSLHTIANFVSLMPAQFLKLVIRIIAPFKFKVAQSALLAVFW